MRYYYAENDTSDIWHKVLSQELSDAIVNVFKEKLMDM